MLSCKLDRQVVPNKAVPRMWLSNSWHKRCATERSAFLPPEATCSGLGGALCAQVHAKVRIEGAGDQEGKQGGDYFVPWHIPLHRVEAAAAAARTQQAASDGAPAASSACLRTPGAKGGDCRTEPAAVRCSDGGADLSSRKFDADARQGAPTGSQPATSSSAMGSAQGGFADGEIDRAKRTVVFKRYYHLFDQGELDSLVLQVPSVRIEDSFYDKSNWCVIYERTQEA